MDVSNWVTDNSLRANRLYYEGFVDDLECLLEYHKIVTVTTYGTRKSRKFAGLSNHIEGKENESPDKQKRKQEEVILSLSMILYRL